MNRKLLRWFDEGNIAEALAGKGMYFIPDVTWRKNHDSILAVGELLDWADENHVQSAVNGFEKAVLELSLCDIEAALLLMRSYTILSRTRGKSLPLNKAKLSSAVALQAEKLNGALKDNPLIVELLQRMNEDYPITNRFSS